jgi:hypothetical protein
MTAPLKRPLEPELSAMGRAAMEWATKGFHVFPVRTDLVSGRKVPRIANWRELATTDTAQITEWWNEWPEANIGCVPDKSGCFVADLDRKGGKDGVARLVELADLIGETLPETLTTRTASGGEHRWFRGRAPNSVDAIAPGIDIRGARETPTGLKLGFVVMPPSRFGDGPCYEVQQDAPIAECPWFSALAIRSAGGNVVMHPVVDVEPDLPCNAFRARTYLGKLVERGEVAIEGQGGDSKTYNVACALHDLGLSEEAALDLLDEEWNQHCRPSWDRDELELKVQNAFAYAQNPWGCEALDGRSAEEAFGPALKRLEAEDHPALHPTEWERRVASFRGREPDEDAELPDLEFWDLDRTLPRYPGGGVGIAYGPSGGHKTNIVLAVAMAAVKDREARVAYLAGEGSHGVFKQRVPALARKHGLPLRELRGRWKTIPRVPLLKDREDVAALIEAQRELRPNIVVIDTLATAISGENENDAATGSLLTDNGPAGAIKRAFGAAVVFVAHSGKNESNGIRGSSAFKGNADFVWKVTADKDAQVAKLYVEKMRDGPDGFCVYYRIDSGLNGVPVATRIPEAEWRARRSSTSSELARAVREALERLNADGEVQIKTRVLSADVVPQVRDETEDERERKLRAMDEKLNSHVRRNKATGQLGPLARYVDVDQFGDPISPYHWRLPLAADDGDGPGEA